MAATFHVRTICLLSLTTKLSKYGPFLPRTSFIGHHWSKCQKNEANNGMRAIPIAPRHFIHRHGRSIASSVISFPFAAIRRRIGKAGAKHAHTKNVLLHQQARTWRPLAVFPRHWHFGRKKRSSGEKDMQVGRSVTSARRGLSAGCPLRQERANI